MNKPLRQQVKRGFDREVNSWNSLYADGNGKHGGRYALFQRSAIARTAARKAACLQILDLKPGMKVLDIGCGSGAFAREVVSGGARWYGVDISYLMLAHGLKTMPKDMIGRMSWINGDVMQVPFKSGSFDAVICVGLINFLGKNRLAGLISEMQRVLKDDCLIVFTSLRLDVSTWLRSRIYPLFPPPISSPGPIYPIHYKRIMHLINGLLQIKCEDMRHMKKYFGLPHYTIFKLRKI